MEFLTEYGMFIAKLATTILFILLAFGGTLFLYSRISSHAREEHLKVEKLNRKYEAMGLALKAAMLPPKAFKQELKQLKNQYKKEKKTNLDTPRKRIFILDFKGDIRASQVASLRDAITAILTAATPADEVVVLLESAGGIVHGYGLAASQLQRIRDKKIRLTVAVDKVAASGGYLMACVADQIIAAPFAIIGSIGVIGQLPNFNRLLKNHDIDFEQITAGEHKRTLTVFGKNTDKDRQKFQEDIDDTHQLFKDFVAKNRQDLDIDKISTGEHWYAIRAKGMKLVDEVRTSDDYLSESAQNADLYHVSYERPQRFIERIFSATASLIGSRLTNTG